MSAAVALGVWLAGSPAWAHNEFEPATAAPGTVISLTLVVANERADAGTTQVQLLFPEGASVPLVELPEVAGWTTTVEGGSVGSPVTAVTWSRPSAEPAEDPRLSLRIGPLPTTAGRLQFKLLQTYSNGEVVRWIDDWPAGAPEPEMPPVILDVTPGGPGDLPVTPASTAPSSTTTTSAPDRASTDDDGDGGLSTGVVVLVVVIGIGVIAVGVAWWVRRLRRSS